MERRDTQVGRILRKFLDRILDRTNQEEFYEKNIDYKFGNRPLHPIDVQLRLETRGHGRADDSTLVSDELAGQRKHRRLEKRA